jgi:hypothetical protein
MIILDLSSTQHDEHSRGRGCHEDGPEGFVGTMWSWDVRDGVTCRPLTMTPAATSLPQLAAVCSDWRSLFGASTDMMETDMLQGPYSTMLRVVATWVWLHRHVPHDLEAWCMMHYIKRASHLFALDKLHVA